MSGDGKSANEQLAALVSSRHQFDVTRRDAGASGRTWPGLLMRLGQRWCGLRAESVREVVSVEPIARVPSQPHYLLGVMLVHSRIVPVLEMSRYMDDEDMALESSPPRRMVIVASGDVEVGVLADDAKGVIDLPGEIANKPGGTGDSLVLGEVHWGDDLVCLLDDKRLVNAVLGAGSA
ncbi:MAG: chemotaxis protein CheW [Myxococcota bacterium]